MSFQFIVLGNNQTVSFTFVRKAEPSKSLYTQREGVSSLVKWICGLIKGHFKVAKAMFKVVQCRDQRSEILVLEQVQYLRRFMNSSKIPIKLLTINLQK